MLRLINNIPSAHKDLMEFSLIKCYNTFSRPETRSEEETELFIEMFWNKFFFKFLDQLRTLVRFMQHSFWTFTEVRDMCLIIGWYRLCLSVWSLRRRVSQLDRPISRCIQSTSDPAQRQQGRRSVDSAHSQRTFKISNASESFRINGERPSDRFSHVGRILLLALVYKSWNKQSHPWRCITMLQISQARCRS